jgi:hypothetical protein
MAVAMPGRLLDIAQRNGGVERGSMKLQSLST